MKKPWIPEGMDRPLAFEYCLPAWRKFIRRLRIQETLERAVGLAADSLRGFNIVLPHYPHFYARPEDGKFGYGYNLVVDMTQIFAASDLSTTPIACLGEKIQMLLALITARYGGMRAPMAADGLDAARWSGRRLRLAVGVGIIGPSFEILIIDAASISFSTTLTAAISRDLTINKHTLPLVLAFRGWSWWGLRSILQIQVPLILKEKFLKVIHSLS